MATLRIRRRGAGARVVVLLVSLAVALVVTSIAAAGSGGLAPESQVSPGVERSADIYWVILGFSGLILALVTVPLVIFMIRFRNRGRPREAEGAQVTGHNKLELAWTIGPVLILVVITAFVFYKVPGITDPEGTAATKGEALKVRVEGRQFYWQFVYENGAIAIDKLRVPLGVVVDTEITAPEGDVPHSFWVPAISGKLDAIPGNVAEISFRADKLGTFKGQCGEFCGIQHAAMVTSIEVMPRDEFEAWVERAARARRTGGVSLGKEEWEGACLKCHRIDGTPLVGPNLGGNPVLQDRKSFEQIVRYGREAMPAVGQEWSKSQMDALYRYVSRNVAKKGDADGGQG